MKKRYYVCLVKRNKSEFLFVIDNYVLEIVEDIDGFAKENFTKDVECEILYRLKDEAIKDFGKIMRSNLRSLERSKSFAKYFDNALMRREFLDEQFEIVENM